MLNDFPLLLSSLPRPGQRSATMGGDNERSVAGTPPVWLAQKGESGGGGGGLEAPSVVSASGARQSGFSMAGVPSRCFQAIEAHSSGVNDVVFEKGGVLLATAGDDSYVKVWDPGSGRQKAALKVTRGEGKHY